MNSKAEPEISFDALQQFLKWGIFPHPDEVKAAFDSADWDGTQAARDAIIDRMYQRAKTIAASQGVVAALPGAVPGLGTAIQVTLAATTVLPETVLLLRKMAHLQLCTAYAHGHKVEHPDNPAHIHPDRLEEFIVVMGIMTGAILPVKEGVKRFGGKLATVQITKRIPGRVLREINRRVGFTLLTKFGTKRGGIALGKVIPLGIGVAIGGGMNYQAIAQFQKVALRFYGEEAVYAMPEE